MRHEQPSEQTGLGTNLRLVSAVATFMTLMMFAVHCTWVTSNAYSSPSIVLASYGNDGSRQILDDFREVIILSFVLDGKLMSDF
jgi:dolichyl-diphosphooligosaccharide---protein glycosyltransferase